jgi:hypothetical protein
MTLAQLMSAHDRAHAMTAGVPHVRPNEPRYEELTAKFDRLLGAEDALLDQLVQAHCADDGEFFEKAAHIIKYGDDAGDEDWAALRLVDATRIHLAARRH